MHMQVVATVAERSAGLLLGHESCLQDNHMKSRELARDFAHRKGKKNIEQGSEGEPSDRRSNSHVLLHKVQAGAELAKSPHGKLGQ